MLNFAFLEKPSKNTHFFGFLEQKSLERKNTLNGYGYNSLIYSLDGGKEQNSFHVTLINPSPKKGKNWDIGYDQNRIMVKLPFGPTTCTGLLTAFELGSNLLR
jgi:hypothetical protein